MACNAKPCMVMTRLPSVAVILLQQKKKEKQTFHVDPPNHLLQGRIQMSSRSSTVCAWLRVGTRGLKNRDQIFPSLNEHQLLVDLHTQAKQVVLRDNH